MWELDDSNIFDWLDNPSIPMSFSPMHNPIPDSGGSHSVDDLMLHTENFGEHGPCIEIDALAKLLRQSLRSLMPIMKIDYKDDEKIRAWMKHSIEIESDLPPVISREQLQELLENCSSSYVFPEWIGCLNLNDIAALDPSRPMQLKGGVIAFLDVVNGAGHTVDLNAQAFLIMQPDQCISREPGRYTLETITGECPGATIKNCDVEQLRMDYRQSKVVKIDSSSECSHG
jgi:hypothetical protein